MAIDEKTLLNSLKDFSEIKELMAFMAKKIELYDAVLEEGLTELGKKEDRIREHVDTVLKAVADTTVQSDAIRNQFMPKVIEMCESIVAQSTSLTERVEALERQIKKVQKE